MPENDSFLASLAVFDFKMRIALILIVLVAVSVKLIYSNLVLPETCEQDIQRIEGNGSEVKWISFDGTSRDGFTGERINGLMEIRADPAVSNVTVYSDGDLISSTELSEPDNSITLSGIERKSTCSTFKFVLEGEQRTVFNITAQMAERR